MLAMTIVLSIVDYFTDSAAIIWLTGYLSAIWWVFMTRSYKERQKEKSKQKNI